MKIALSFTTFVVLFMLLFTTGVNLSSCTKDPITIHDTTTTTVHDTTTIRDTTKTEDTTIITIKDTLKLTLSPCKNPNEASVDSYYPTGNGVGIIQLVVGYWSHAPSVEINRTYIKFDYADLPANAVIISAQLSLYANPTPIAGNFTDADFGNANAMFIQRITTDWSPASISWNNQPTSTSANQVSIPQTVSNFEDNINIDVTNLVSDMTVNGNYGFALKLQNENNIFNIRQYASSYNAESGKMPKLVIYYKKP